MQNLRDKLLQAGLVSEDQAKKVQSEAPARRPPSEAPRAQPSRPPRPSGPRPEGRGGEFRGGRPEPRRTGAPQGERRGGGGPRPERAAPIPKLPPLAVPNNKEFQRLEAKKQVELERQIRELVLANQVQVEAGGHTFYFVTRKNRLRRIEMTPELAARLEHGELAVVERPEPAQIEHSIVPAETALQILALSERAVRFFNRNEQPIGFLSDDELSRRQVVEANREAAAEEQEKEPRITPATVPDEADLENVEVEPLQGNEEVAERAERISVEVPGEE